MKTVATAVISPRTSATTASAGLREAALREIERVEWIPPWGVDRMRNMFKGRPDWCVSRQRVWGVSIPVFYCAGCTEAVADPAIINRVADVFEKESADAWYTREARELLPEGYKCKQVRRRRMDQRDGHSRCLV